MGGIETRLADSFETALGLADGLAFVDLADGTVAEALALPSLAREGSGGGCERSELGPRRRSGPSERADARTHPQPLRSREGSGSGKLKGAEVPDNRIVFSEKFACPVSGFSIAEIEPRLFSFNAPQGACPACDGLGEKLIFDPDLVVPNGRLSLKKGAVMPWAKSNPPSPYYQQVLASLGDFAGFTLDTEWDDLTDDQRALILHGSGRKPVPLTFKDGRKQYTVQKAFEGVIGNLNRRLLQTESAWMREELSRYQSAQPCETCLGARLKPEALSVKIATASVAEVVRLSVLDALAWFDALPPSWRASRPRSPPPS